MFVAADVRHERGSPALRVRLADGRERGPRREGNGRPAGQEAILLEPRGKVLEFVDGAVVEFHVECLMGPVIVAVAVAAVAAALEVTSGGESASVELNVAQEEDSRGFGLEDAVDSRKGFDLDWGLGLKLDLGIFVVENVVDNDSVEDGAGEKGGNQPTGQREFHPDRLCCPRMLRLMAVEI
mmetsp:Transcript_31023/g.65442  ORF Transcript_31023/g.65442 Transcript_31023/m.65442 type:complete len:182 (-) Transcript_31023:306-851(-)